MKLSVIIPTYNNSRKLNECLGAVFGQTLNIHNYDVIVINDGSTDDTDKVVKKLRKKHKFDYVEQKNLGPGAARNAGIKRAEGDVIVLIQDDIVIDRNFLKEHLRFHKKYNNENTAVVGFTTWHLSLKITPFMYWLEHGGPQFDYDRIKGKLRVDFLAFYTSNLSIRKTFFEPFDEDFFIKGTTAYEDTELGYRLEKRGMALYYNPNAKAYHKEKKTLKQILKRQYGMGRVSHLLYRKHPHLKTSFLSDELRYKATRPILNRVLVWPLEKLAFFIEGKINIPFVFKLVSRYWYNKGYGESN